jgi:hypothetical protein
MFFDSDVLHRKISLCTCGIHCIAIIRDEFIFSKLEKATVSTIFEGEGITRFSKCG